MLKRHEDSLMERFDIVALRGFATIERWELNLWYGMERISKNVWRDLRDRFNEVRDNDSDELYIYEGSSFILIVNSDNLKLLSKFIL